MHACTYQATIYWYLLHNHVYWPKPWVLSSFMSGSDLVTHFLSPLCPSSLCIYMYDMYYTEYIPFTRLKPTNTSPSSFPGRGEHSRGDVPSSDVLLPADITCELWHLPRSTNSSQRVSGQVLLVSTLGTLIDTPIILLWYFTVILYLHALVVHCIVRKLPLNTWWQIKNYSTF